MEQSKGRNSSKTSNSQFGEQELSEDSEDPDEPANIENELETFRYEWKHEVLRKTGSALSDVQQNVISQKVSNDEPVELFLEGIVAEQNGLLIEAIQFYRKAMQLDPDVESRIDYKQLYSRNHTISESSISSHEDQEDLVVTLQEMDIDEQKICVPKNNQNIVHISILPNELLMYILKWVVSSDLDVYSLENLSLVSRGFYMLSRDEDIWRLICRKIWGAKYVSPPRKYLSWRNMYYTKPHLNFSGCYISEMSYFRQGERSLSNCQILHFVKYYRMIHFFPEGDLIMYTTSDDPQTCVGKLKSRDCQIQGILQGHYKMVNNKVSCILTRKKKKETQIRYKRSNRNLNENNASEQTFIAELAIKNTRKRKNVILEWEYYAIKTMYPATNEEEINPFEINRENYPALFFSRVKSFTSNADVPLE